MPSLTDKWFQLNNLHELRAVELPIRDHPFEDLKEVLHYWESKRGTRFAPARADLDPLDLRRAMSRILLADVIADPFDIRCRLVGTHITDVHGIDATGQSVRSIEPRAYGELLWSHYKDCVDRKVPLLHLIHLHTTNKARSYARLVLPFSEDNKSVTMLMAVGNEQQNTEELKAFFEEASGQPVG